MKKILLVFAVFVFLQILFVPVSAEERFGYPVYALGEESLSVFLDKHHWKAEDISTPQKGAIKQYAISEDESLCAILLENHIFVYNEGEKTHCFFYETEGMAKLLFYNRCLVVYEVRGDYLLVVDLLTNETELYQMVVAEAESHLQTEFYKFGDSPNTDASSKYNVTNHVSWKWLEYFYNTDEILIYRDNGYSKILYESNHHIVNLTIFCFAVLVGCVVGIVMIFRKWRKTRDG